MKLVIIKYNAGNVCSVEFGLQRLGVNAITTDDTEEILSADKIIFPGVGAAGVAMEYLREKKLDELIKNCKQPFLEFVWVCNCCADIQRKMIQHALVCLMKQ
jgi:glutamine amidotransferase